MRNLETGEPFKFEVKEGDRAYNQKHYEALGEVGSWIVRWIKHHSLASSLTIYSLEALQDKVKS